MRSLGIPRTRTENMWQACPERTALPRRTRDSNCPAMALDELLRGYEPQATATSRPTESAPAGEQLWKIRVGNTDPGVLDLEAKARRIVGCNGSDRYRAAVGTV